MLHITKLMIDVYKIVDMDFMGYSIDPISASFHHLIVPKRNGGPKTINNGAILNRGTSHAYLHLIELKDYDYFYDITKEMIDENKKGFLDITNIKRIDDILNNFEREHSGDVNFQGEPLIHEEYVKRLVKGKE